MSQTKAAAKEWLKEQERDLRRSIIFNATLRLLVDKSFDSITMDDISLEVGLAKATLYKSFISKEDLYVSMATMLLKKKIDLLVLIDKDKNTPIPEKIKHLLNTLVRNASTEINNSDVIPVPVFPHILKVAPPEVQKAYLNMKKMLIDLTQQILGTSCQIPHCAISIVSLLEGLCHELWLQNKHDPIAFGSKQIEQILKNTLEIIFKGLA